MAYDPFIEWLRDSGLQVSVPQEEPPKPAVKKVKKKEVSIYDEPAQEEVDAEEVEMEGGETDEISE